MYKFFVESNQINNNKVKIIGEDYNHIANVLRMKKDEKILITNKETADTFECAVYEINKNEVICNIICKKDNSSELNVDVDLFQGLPKSDKFEYIIQKAVELGVHKIIPLNMKFCVAKIKDEEKKNIRWNKISEVAAKQSKRDIIPKVQMSLDMNDLYKELEDYDLIIVAYENESKTTIKEVLQQNKNAKRIALVIGPEGGISDSEIQILKDINVKMASLGKRILRTETAPIAALSMIIYEYEL